MILQVKPVDIDGFVGPLTRAVKVPALKFTARPGVKMAGLACKFTLDQ